MDVTTAISADPICREHLRGLQHPERPERFDVIVEALRRADLLDRRTRLDARAAIEDELILCHTPEYLQVARRDIASGSARRPNWRGV